MDLSPGHCPLALSKGDSVPRIHKRWRKFSMKRKQIRLVTQAAGTGDRDLGQCDSCYLDLGWPWCPRAQGVFGCTGSGCWLSPQVLPSEAASSSAKPELWGQLYVLLKSFMWREEMTEPNLVNSWRCHLLSKSSSYSFSKRCLWIYDRFQLKNCNFELWGQLSLIKNCIDVKEGDDRSH